MLRSLTSALVTLIFITTAFTQDKPVPDYVTTQDFPDSVKTLSLTKLDGTHVTFADVLQLHQGKKVVIDIWASWCRDCIVGLPKLNELRKKTGEDVVYVFLSLDKDDLRWKTAIERFNIQGDHYWIEAGWRNPLANYMVLDWVPRCLVLNEKGRVIMPKAIVADDQTLHKSLVE